LIERDDAFREYERATWAIGIALAIGFLALLVFALQAGSVVGYTAIVGAGIALFGGAFALGAVSGFLFGIPRRLQESPALTTTETGEGSSVSGVPYAGNTSLEQISDWLTKIIVGVGLTQLMNVPSALGRLGEVVGPALGGFPGSSALGTLEFIFFGVGGFFAAYLWTRLRLTSLLVESDEEAKRKVRETELRAIEAKTDLRGVASEALPAPSGETVGAGVAAVEPRSIQLLWVDDRPANNAREIDQLKAQGIGVTTMTDSDTALAELQANPTKYDAVITDLKRGTDYNAGYKFIDDARSKLPESNVPFIVYTKSNSPTIDQSAKSRGAIGGTNSPIRLFELINKALHRPS
jgi:CheY-like chemotaxis protein